MIISVSTDLFEPGVPQCLVNPRMAPQSNEHVPVSDQAIPAPASPSGMSSWPLESSSKREQKDPQQFSTLLARKWTWFLIRKTIPVLGVPLPRLDEQCGHLRPRSV